MPLANTCRGSWPTPGGQAPEAVPALSSSRVRHARQREAALGRGGGRPAGEGEAAAAPGSGRR